MFATKPVAVETSPLIGGVIDLASRIPEIPFKVIGQTIVNLGGKRFSPETSARFGLEADTEGTKLTWQKYIDKIKDTAFGQPFSQTTTAEKIKDLPKAAFGAAETIGFDIGKWLNQSDVFGKISATANVDGKRWLNDNPEAQIKGTLQQLEYNNYSYSNVELNGIIKQKQCTGSIVSADPNINFNFNGLVNFYDSIPTFKFNAAVNKIDFAKLHFVQTPFAIEHVTILS